MLLKSLLHQVGIVLVVACLAFTPGTTMAQSVPEDVDEGDDTPAAIEVMVDETITLDMTEGRSTTASKQRVQETTKAVPSEGDTSEDDTSKQNIFLPLVWGNGELNATVEAAEATAGWYPLMNEGFEGIWPNAGWSTYDCNGSYYGDFYWNDVPAVPYSVSAYSGSWTAWPAGNLLDPDVYYYPNNACAWMIYGPFSLQSKLGSWTGGYVVGSASLSFALRAKTEPNYDWIGWYVSCDGVNWSGVKTSGNTAGWDIRSLSLDGCLGDSTVWIGFKFTSDYSIVDVGPFIDNVIIERYLGFVK